MYNNPTIDQIYQQQQKAQLGELKASRQKALGKLNQEKKQISPMYQGQRNQTDVVHTQNANRLREIMAANGLGASGENVTANTNLMNARQNSLNSLNLQEQQATNDINRRISDVNNPDERNSIIARIQAARNQALLEQMNRDRQMEWEQEQFNTLSAYQKAQIEQQNRARAASSSRTYQRAYEKAYEDFMKKMAEQEYQNEIEALRQYSNGVVDKRNTPSDRNVNYRPQF